MPKGRHQGVRVNTGIREAVCAICGYGIRANIRQANKLIEMHAKKIHNTDTKNSCGKTIFYKYATNGNNPRIDKSSDIIINPDTSLKDVRPKKNKPLKDLNTN